MAYNYIDDTDYSVVDDVDIDMIASCTEESLLAEWYVGMCALYDYIKWHMLERKDAGVGSDDYFDSTAGKLAYLRIGKARVERRMIELGFHPPYPPADPRTKQQRILEAKIKKLKGILKANGIEFEETVEPAHA